MLIGPEKGLELIKVFINPGQGFGEALVEALLIAPAEGLPNRGAGEQVTLVFAQAFTALFHHRLEGHAATLADLLHQGSDADRLFLERCHVVPGSASRASWRVAFTTSWMWMKQRSE